MILDEFLIHWAYRHEDEALKIESILDEIASLINSAKEQHLDPGMVLKRVNQIVIAALPNLNEHEAGIFLDAVEGLLHHYERNITEQ